VQSGCARSRSLLGGEFQPPTSRDMSPAGCSGYPTPLLLRPYPVVIMAHSNGQIVNNEPEIHYQQRERVSYFEPAALSGHFWQVKQYQSLRWPSLLLLWAGLSQVGARALSG